MKGAEIHDALHDRLSVLAACDAPSLLGMLLNDAPGALLGIGVRIALAKAGLPMSRAAAGFQERLAVPRARAFTPPECRRRR